MVSILDSSSSLLLNSLYQNVLPPSFNPPNCFLSLFLSFSFFLCRCSPPSVYLSQIPTIRRCKEKQTIVYSCNSGIVRTLPSSAGIQFAFTRSFSLFLPLSLTHCIVYSTLSSLSALHARSRLERRCAPSRSALFNPVPRNTHAFLFARSIDGLINDVSTVSAFACRTAVADGTASARIAATTSIAHIVDSVDSAQGGFVHPRHRRRHPPRRRTRRRRYPNVDSFVPSVAFPLLSLSLFFPFLPLFHAFFKSHSPCTQTGVYYYCMLVY